MQIPVLQSRANATRTACNSLSCSLPANRSAHLHSGSAGDDPCSLDYTKAMCGRYRLTAKERYLRDHFGLDEDVGWPPRWNIAPTQQVPTIRQDARAPRRSWAMVRWGLIPSWAKDASIGFRTINAQSETAAEKPAFRDAMRSRRCLVPADGFYEWKKLGPKEKQPYNLGLADDGIFAFAGLWEIWRDRAAAQNVETCTVLTTSANSLVADVHNRMPVILSREDYDQWLDPGVTDPARVADLLKPFDARLMRCFPVSNRVSRIENDDAEFAREVSPKESTPTLF
jgi:putative SOS response-associated peptidase YedK